MFDDDNGSPGLFDHAEVTRTLNLLLPDGQVTELRALDAVLTGERRRVTATGYFDDRAKLIESLENIRSAKGIYLTLNPVDPELLARAANRIRSAVLGDSTADINIIARRWLMVDFDPVRPAGISSSDGQHEAALLRARRCQAHLSQCDWPEPIVADSGNGAHLLYPIDLPVSDRGLVSQCLSVLAATFNDPAVTVDTTVHNPARIWKLYGTPACKGDNTPDRPHRISRILSAPVELEPVPRKYLEELAAEAPIDPRSAQNGSPRHEKSGGSFDVAAFIARHNLDVEGPHDWHGRQGTGQRWIFRTSPMCDHHDRSAFVVKHASGAITAHCHHNSCSWTWHDFKARYEPSGDASPSSGNGSAFSNGAGDEWLRSPVLVNLADVQPEEVRWLWSGRIALGKLTLIAGDPGLGKSFLSLDIAARVSTGCKWPDCSDLAPCGSVILLSAEDDLADTIRPRLDAAKADVRKIVFLKAVKNIDTLGQYERPFDLQRDLTVLEQSLEQHSDCRLLIIDPISAYLGKTDSHINSEVRAVLAPLAEMAALRGIAILAITHLRKGEGAAVYRAMGSLAFIAAAQGAWAVAKDKVDETRRLFLPIKNNLGNDQSGLAFRLTSAHTGTVPCVEWLAEPVSITVNEALAPERKQRGRPAEELEKAVNFLQSALTKGPKPAKEIQDEAINGHCIAKRTLDRAREKLSVVAFRPENPGPWFWRLSEY